MTQPSAIVFDLGKVLLDFDYAIAARNLEAAGRAEVDEIKKHLSQTDLLVRYETGLISRAEFFEKLCRAARVEWTMDAFEKHFTDIFSEIPAMIGLHTTFRKMGFPTYIFSNTNELQLSYIRRKFPFFANFDGYILSYEVRSMKPDAKIYEALERMAGKRGGDLLYIDDRAENIAAGAARGWQTILQETPEKTIAAVNKLGLLNHA